MALKYRTDDGLVVLGLCSHDDLERLARILTHDASDGEKRRSQELLNNPEYQAAVEQGDLRPVWKIIAAELQAFGGDSIANTWRSLTQDYTGVLYREIVADICSRFKVSVKKAVQIKDLEDKLLVALLESQKGRLTPEALQSVTQEVAKGVGLEDCLPEGMAFDELIESLATDARVSYVAALVAPVIVSGVLPFLERLTLPTVTAAVGLRLSSAIVPGAGLVTLAASTVALLTSPAVRVTLPAVLEVIRIRRSVILSPMNAAGAA